METRRSQRQYTLSPLNRAYCARLGMRGNSMLARNLSQRNSGTDCAQIKISEKSTAPNVRNTHSSVTKPCAVADRRIRRIRMPHFILRCLSSFFKNHLFLFFDVGLYVINDAWLPAVSCRCTVRLVPTARAPAGPALPLCPQTHRWRGHAWRTEAHLRVAQLRAAIIKCTASPLPKSS